MLETKENILRFGSIAVQLKYTTSERINECIRIQKQMKELGIQPKELGELMIDKGYLTDEQVKHIFRLQGIKGGHTNITGYKIISLIGRGSMGNVYKALQISMDRIVGLKILAPHLAQNEKFVARFFQEARSVAKLNHPNIMQGIDVGESNGVHYFVMEYIDGPDLEEVTKKNGPSDEKKALQIIIQIAKALDHAHKNNMIHRDIKPSNIMIKNDGTAKLCDLGLARLLTKEVGTHKRIIMGTPSYISPEQARGEPDVDIRTDIYSLGATLYYMLVGDIPFQGETSTEIIKKHINANLIPPRMKKSSISKLTNNIIVKMMQKQKCQRFNDPQELLKHLEETLGKPSSQVKPLVKQTRIRSFSKLNRFRRGGRKSGIKSLSYKRKTKK